MNSILTAADKAQLKMMWLLLIILPAFSMVLMTGAVYMDSIPAGEVNGCEVTHIQKKIIQDIPILYVDTSCGMYGVTNFITPPKIEVGHTYTFTLKGTMGMKTISSATAT